MSMLQDRAAKSPMPGAVAGFERIQRFWDARIQHWSAKILPGEFYVTRNVEAVSTVLGSCVAACIRDVKLGVGGMNHFMLPEEASVGVDAWSALDGTPSTRYGSYAMESLVNEVLKLGARRDRLEIKLFGGGRILPAMTDVGARNIAFVRGYTALEGFHVAAEDMGGIEPRHVIFFPASGRVLLKKLQPLETNRIAVEDLQYREKFVDQPVDNDVELFE